MSEIGAVILHGLDKFLNNGLNALRAARGFGQVSQLCKQRFECGFFSGMESLLNHLVDIFADSPALEGYPFVPALNLKL